MENSQYENGKYNLMSYRYTYDNSNSISLSTKKYYALKKINILIELKAFFIVFGNIDLYRIDNDNDYISKHLFFKKRIIFYLKGINNIDLFIEKIE